MRNKDCPCRRCFAVVTPEYAYGYYVMSDGPNGKELCAYYYIEETDPNKVFQPPKIMHGFSMPVKYCPFCGRKLRGK